MTEAELFEKSRLIAERVMGWVSDGFVYHWQVIDTPCCIAIHHWKPWEKEDQAWEIIDRLVSIGWLVTIKTMPKGEPFWMTNDPVSEPNARLYARAACELYWVRKEEPPTGHGWHSYPRFTPGDSRPMAIFLAAVKVAEEWKEKV